MQPSRGMTLAEYPLKRFEAEAQDLWKDRSGRLRHRQDSQPKISNSFRNCPENARPFTREPLPSAAPSAPVLPEPLFY